MSKFEKKKSGFHHLFFIFIENILSFFQNKSKQIAPCPKEYLSKFDHFIRSFILSFFKMMLSGFFANLLALSISVNSLFVEKY